MVHSCHWLCCFIKPMLFHLFCSALLNQHFFTFLVQAMKKSRNFACFGKYVSIFLPISCAILTELWSFVSFRVFFSNRPEIKKAKDDHRPWNDFLCVCVCVDFWWHHNCVFAGETYWGLTMILSYPAADLTQTIPQTSCAPFLICTKLWNWQAWTATKRLLAW